MSRAHLSPNAAAVWERRFELDNWNFHVAEITGATGERPAHESVEHALALVRSLNKYVACPWGIDLTPQDVLALCWRVLTSA